MSRNAREDNTRIIEVVAVLCSKGKTKDQSEDEALESDVRVWGIYSRRRKLEGNLGNNKAAAGREP